MELENVTSPSQSRALSAVAITFSCIIMMLSSVLTVMSTGEGSQAYFGKLVAGGTVSSMLTHGDRHRFDAIILEATCTRVMQSSPASVEQEFAALQVQ